MHHVGEASGRDRRQENNNASNDTDTYGNIMHHSNMSTTHYVMHGVVVTSDAEEVVNDAMKSASKGQS